MSELSVAPDIVVATSGNLQNIGSALRSANAAAAPATTSVIAAAEDEVSAAIASLFSSHAQQFQALGAEAAAFHDEFVSALSGAANSYATAEAANLPSLFDEEFLKIEHEEVTLLLQKTQTIEGRIEQDLAPGDYHLAITGEGNDAFNPLLTRSGLPTDVTDYVLSFNDVITMIYRDIRGLL